MQTEYHFGSDFAAPATVEDTIAALTEFFGPKAVGRNVWAQWQSSDAEMQTQAEPEFLIFRNGMIWPFAAGLRGTLIAFPGATWISITDGDRQCAVDAGLLLSAEFAEGWDFRNSEPDYSLMPEADEADADDFRNWGILDKGFPAQEEAKEVLASEPAPVDPIPPTSISAPDKPKGGRPEIYHWENAYLGLGAEYSVDGFELTPKIVQERFRKWFENNPRIGISKIGLAYGHEGSVPSDDTLKKRAKAFINIYADVHKKAGF